VGERRKFSRKKKGERRGQTGTREKSGVEDTLENTKKMLISILGGWMISCHMEQGRRKAK